MWLLVAPHHPMSRSRWYLGAVGMAVRQPEGQNMSTQCIVSTRDLYALLWKHPRMIHCRCRKEGHLVKEMDNSSVKCGHTGGQLVKGSDYVGSDPMEEKFVAHPWNGLWNGDQIVVIGWEWALIRCLDRYRKARFKKRDLRWLRDCAREEGAGRAGPTHLIPRRGNFGLSEDGDQDGDDQMVGFTERKSWQDPDTLFWLTPTNLNMTILCILLQMNAIFLTLLLKSRIWIISAFLSSLFIRQ